MTDPDPIAELFRDLERDGKPSLAWVVRWSQGGRDPVAEAWGAAYVTSAMLTLLWRARRYAEYAAAEEAVRGSLRIIGYYPPQSIRRAVPVPPTLAELLERA